jgi:hypothetical protein
MILKSDDFPNLLDHITISAEEILSQIKHYPLTFDKYKNQKVEWGMKLPMFIDSFYPFVIQNGKVPSQEELWIVYKSQKSIQHLFKSDDIERGIKARLLRTYPSLVRDLHFSIFLKEKSKGAKVIYNLTLDTKYGVDILIDYNSTLYAINLFTPTTRALIGRSKKVSRHEVIENVVNIELPVEFNDQHKWGEFFLYGEKQIIKLRELFKNLKNGI